VSQSQWIRTMLEKPHVIYRTLETGESNNMRRVLASPILNIEQCLIVAANNGHPAVMATLLASATH
ncbi:hypothetical protein BDW02DRAFT_494620, partial [Decorospora gaudefroyi]